MDKFFSSQFNRSSSYGLRQVGIEKDHFTHIIIDEAGQVCIRCSLIKGILTYGWSIVDGTRSNHTANDGELQNVNHFVRRHETARTFRLCTVSFIYWKRANVHNL